MIQGICMLGPKGMIENQLYEGFKDITCIVAIVIIKNKVPDVLSLNSELLKRWNSGFSIWGSSF